MFTRAINKSNEGQPDFSPIPEYFFYDLNAKANYQLGRKDQLFLTGYYGRDVFGFNSDQGFNFAFNWGNSLAALRWQHVYNSRLFLNTTASFTHYQYNITNKLDQFSFSLASTIRDLNLRTDLEWHPVGGRHVVKFGALLTNHNFGVGRLRAGSQSGQINFGSDVQYTGQEGAFYAADNFKVSDKLQVDYGLRLTGFHSGSDTYGGVEPRAAVRYSLSPTVALKASYALMYQYVHLVTNSGTSLPTDIWYPSRQSVRPQRSQQVATGASFLLGKGKYLLTNEVYYKWAQNQIDFRDGAQLFANNDLNAEFLFGRGWAYGNEFYLEKKQGRTTGWIGYTLAWTKRKFPPQLGATGINNGATFYPSYDRRHNLTVVLLHQLSPRINLTGSFLFTSGKPTTLPDGRFGFQDIYGGESAAVPLYPARNSYRLAPYNRLDLGLVYKLRPRHGESDLTLSIYNAYNRRNPYFVYVDQVKDPQTKQLTGYQVKQVSLFPAIPSVTYNFKF